MKKPQKNKFTIIEIIAIILYTNVDIALIIVSCIVLPSLITIVWTFVFAYKEKGYKYLITNTRSIILNFFIIQNFKKKKY